jgi:hypothetical protein
MPVAISRGGPLLLFLKFEVIVYYRTIIISDFDYRLGNFLRCPKIGLCFYYAV